MQKTRLRIFSFFCLVVFLGLAIRLFNWQVLEGGNLLAQGRAQYRTSKSVESNRGDILSQDGSWLVGSVDSFLLYISKTSLKRTSREVANILAPLLVEDSSDSNAILDEAMRIEGLLEKNSVWIPIKNRVSLDIKKNIEALDISGVGFEIEETRYYPEASSAAHLLGFLGKTEDGGARGYFGLEGFYDLVLGGKPGLVARESDASGRPLFFGKSREVEAKGGVDLITHIRKPIQLAVEERLKEGIERYGASAGSVIVMNPNDGAIYAMASFPSYDPFLYFEFGDSYFKDPIISDSFEPGSVFKPIVMAAALDAGVIEPDTKCDICDGAYKVDKYFIETWNQKYYPDSTMTDVIVHSDNVGMVFVGNKLGADKLYDYLNAFGIGRITSIDLQGEASPGMRKKGTWNIVDLATATFGQGIAVTPIQLIKAMAVLANGGFEVTPQVVDKISVSGELEDIEPQLGGRVISLEASLQTREMMFRAASDGEAKWTALRGYPVAGKTGTAQIPVSGHYDEDKTIASFIGMAPWKDPKFIMLVTLREPQSSQWASETAAPLWFSIARDLFSYFGIQPES